MPGTAWNCSSIVRDSASSCCTLYPAACGFTWTMYRFVASSFMSVPCSLFRLSANNPAPTSSTSDHAACSTTNDLCNHHAPAAVDLVPLRKASDGSAWADIHAGTTPNNTPVAIEKPRANTRTSHDGLA